MTSVLVIGAAGKQGGAVLGALLDRGHEVTHTSAHRSRPPPKRISSAGARLVPGRLEDREALEAAARGVDAIFGCPVPFGAGGKDEEVSQGRLLIDAAARSEAHLVYSSVRGADRVGNHDIDHADSKKLIEAHLRARRSARPSSGRCTSWRTPSTSGSAACPGVLANPLLRRQAARPGHRPRHRRPGRPRDRDPDQMSESGSTWSRTG